VKFPQVHLKKKLTKEGSQLYKNIVQLKFDAADGKKYAAWATFSLRLPCSRLATLWW